MSAEHLWGQWIGRLFPDSEFHWTVINPETQEGTTGKSKSIDKTVKAVCKGCNETWMSDLEEATRQILSGVIRDGSSRIFASSEIATLAAFAFKSSVIANYLNPKREGFVSRADREHFRESLTVPRNIQMWTATLIAPVTTAVFVGYVISPQLAIRKTLWDDLEIYVFTFAAGHLVFQVVATRYGGILNRGKKLPIPKQKPFWNNSSLQFFPATPNALVWPPAEHLNDQSLHTFIRRWQGPIRLI